MQFPELVPRALVTLTRRGVSVIGAREARLLQAVERVKSIKDAAAEAGISYRTAWSAIQQMEQALGRPIATAHAVSGARGQARNDVATGLRDAAGRG